MRYVTFSANVASYEIRDDYNMEWVASLRSDLSARLESWNRRYVKIITSGDRKDTLLISELDEEGLALRRDIENVLGDVKVRYYSEGLLRYLDEQELGRS